MRWVKLASFQKCIVFVKSPKQILQIAILNLKSELPVHNSKKTYLDFTLRIVITHHITLSEKATLGGDQKRVQSYSWSFQIFLNLIGLAVLDAR